MLWAIIKVVVFVALVTGAAFGAGYLLELDGGVRIVVAAREFNLTPLMAAVALVLLVLLVWILTKLAALVIAVLKFINGDETAISRYFDRNRQEKGYRALSEGLMALASGEGDLAMSKAHRAERFLHKPDLTNLITAQAAEMSGDRRKAEAVYKRLLKDEKTRFVGVRGILKQKLSDGDTDTALKLAERAFRIKPSHEEIQDTLLQLQTRNGDWEGARATLGAKLKHGSIPRDLHRRRDAVLALSEAREVADEGATIEARESAIEANRLSPDLVPAAVLAARGYIAQAAKRHAARVIRKAWEAQPHPDLARVFAEIQPDETPAARLKRFGKLIKAHPGHRETRLLEAELHIASEDFPAARRALGDLPEEDPDSRVLTVMAAVERGEGSSDEVVKGWLARALSAPRGPQWVCDNCHHIHSDWAPTCENCHAFDTLRWRSPPASGLSMPTDLEMLPLIVGSGGDRDARAAGEPGATESPLIPEAEIVDEQTPGKTRQGG